MKLLKLLPLLVAFAISCILGACSGKQALEQKPNQSQAGDRINKAKQNTDDLFKEMD